MQLSIPTTDYVVKVAEPTGTAEEACQAMYAVSAYSVSVQRSMEVVNLLTTDTDVVNLLAYGVDEVNYVFDEANSIINLTDLKPGDENYYRMNPDYAGNQYKRYPSSESDASELATAADNWAAGKAQNLSTIELPYANFVVNTTPFPDMFLRTIWTMRMMMRLRKVRPLPQLRRPNLRSSLWMSQAW